MFQKMNYYVIYYRVIQINRQAGWGNNDRGVSVTFNETVLKNFLGKNDLDLLCRVHQVVEDG